jgi:hypothetical protein
MPIGTPKNLISFEDGVSKWNGRLEGDHITHFKSWIKRLIVTKNMVVQIPHNQPFYKS